jgi:hypothetical protein
MKLTITIDKRHFYVIALLLVSVIGVITVTAYQSGSPANVFGHSSEEIVVSIDDLNMNLQDAVDQLYQNSELRQDTCEWIPAHCMGGHGCPAASEYEGICQENQYMAGFKLFTWGAAATYNHQVYCCNR